jgi:predicted nucleic acid-binding protein
MFLDSQFVIAVANKRDENHLRAVALSGAIEGHSLVTTDAVILEIGNSLARALRPVAVKLIGHMLDSDEVQIVPLEPDLLEKAFELYRDHDYKTWSLVDCISFVVMRELDIGEALTFDKHFVQAGFRALLLESPES